MVDFLATDSYRIESHYRTRIDFLTGLRRVDGIFEERRHLSPHNTPHGWGPK